MQTTTCGEDQKRLSKGVTAMNNLLNDINNICEKEKIIYDAFSYCGSSFLKFDMMSKIVNNWQLVKMLANDLCNFSTNDLTALFNPFDAMIMRWGERPSGWPTNNIFDGDSMKLPFANVREFAM
ncbi:hypothetical protein KIN20_027613 [Parelaphostrongylus tenuis]|uniref:Uncharacterized protein n=1 Tax=Parelaphostrongylus tenuis TaxID=148309 RepID=A0AAD5QZY3_PARTN|nr:hypothetical protein KIN20_027613 [Parelaphostrongylus tenuis]